MAAASVVTPAAVQAASVGPAAPPRDLYLKQFSKRTKIRRSVYKQAAAKWTGLDFAGTPPGLWALEG